MPTKAKAKEGMPSWWSVMAWIALIVATSFAVVSSIGCNAPQRLAKKCAALYPNSVVEKTVTEYKQGKTDTVDNYVLVNCDSVVAANKTQSQHSAKSLQSSIVRVPCPPTLIRVDTFNQLTTKTITNTASFAALNNAEAGLKKWRTRALITWGILALIIGVGIYVRIKTAPARAAKKLL